MRLGLQLSMGVLLWLCFITHTYATPDERFHKAVSSGNILQVNQLIKKKDANINARDKDGNTCLVLSLRERKQDIAKALLTHKEIDTNIANHYGRTALSWAAFYGFTEIVGLLLDKKAEIDYQRDGNFNALLTATDNGKDETAQLLVSRGANVHVQSSFGSTPLLLAAKNHCIGTVEAILKQDTRINHQNTWGVTPLIAACQQGDVAIVRALIEKKAELNSQTNEKKTALDYAMHNGHKVIADLLISHDAHATWII